MKVSRTCFAAHADRGGEDFCDELVILSTGLKGVDEGEQGGRPSFIRHSGDALRLGRAGEARNASTRVFGKRSVHGRSSPSCRSCSAVRKLTGIDQLPFRARAGPACAGECVDKGAPGNAKGPTDGGLATAGIQSGDDRFQLFRCYSGRAAANSASAAC